MGDAARKLMGKRDQPGQREHDKPLPQNEKRALKKLQQSAKKQGCLLSSNGEGGLPPSLIWHVFKRDADENGKFRCKVCGEKGTEENQGLGAHHKNQHIAAPAARARGIRDNATGKRNDPAGLIVVCGRDHDAVHQRDRAENPGQPDADEMDNEH